MPTNDEIRKKWRDICQRPRRNPHVIDSGTWAVELVRWAIEENEREIVSNPSASALICSVCSHPAGEHNDAGCFHEPFCSCRQSEELIRYGKEH